MSPWTQTRTSIRPRAGAERLVFVRGMPPTSGLTVPTKEPVLAQHLYRSAPDPDAAASESRPGRVTHGEQATGPAGDSAGVPREPRADKDTPPPTTESLGQEEGRLQVPGQAHGCPVRALASRESQQSTELFEKVCTIDA